MNFKSTILSSAIIFALAGCGSSNDEAETTPPQASDKTTFSLGISDAPATGLKQVNVVFDSITIKAQAGEEVSFATRSKNDSTLAQMVNLLDYTGDDIFQLLDDQEVPAGDYSWIRAQVINGDTNNLSLTSHVVYEDGSIAPLIVKRKGNDGVGEIQLDGFTLNQTDNEFVLEFDLKKSLVDPQNNDEIFLKPRGVRLQNLSESQDIEGTVSQTLINNCETDNIDLAADDSSFGHAVYLYSAQAQTPTDMHEIDDQTPDNAPLATANVVFDADDNEYEFELAFITPGDYQLGYTCSAHIDDAEQVDADFNIYQLKQISLTQADDLSVNFDIAQ